MAIPDGQPKPDANPGDRDKDEAEEWRHAPMAPKDANPLDSLGRAVTDSVTGSAADKGTGPQK